jgi:NitT/TauT family transport system substrate-binding protein
MIKADDKIADVLIRHPELKDALIKRNPRFRNLNNPVVFNTVGKYARIRDVAKVSGDNLEELLDYINNSLNMYES